MVNTIPFIDMHRSPEDSINCWIVYLLDVYKRQALHFSHFFDINRTGLHFMHNHGKAELV